MLPLRRKFDPPLVAHLSPAERASIAAEMLAFLRRHVMEAWYPRSVDRAAGGFSSEYDRAWNPAGSQRRMLEFQARHTRAAARLALAFPGEAQWAEFALHGFRFLRDAMWDREQQGWFWMLDAGGAPLEGETKHAHGTAYAVQTCAVVFAATGETGALELGREGFAWFDRHARDEEFGGYRNWLQRDGSLVVPTSARKTEPLGYGLGLKDANVHGDWIEGLTEFLAVGEDAEIRARLTDFCRDFVTHLVTEEGAIQQACHRDWRPQPALEKFGFNVQAAHRLNSAADLLGSGLPLRECASRILAHTIDRAWAGHSGGFYFAGPAGAPNELEGVSLTVQRRSWWVQTEGLRSLLLHALRDDDLAARHAGLFRATWALLRDRMCDPTYGGVYSICPDDLPLRSRPFGRWRHPWILRKGDLWKDASHEVDGLLACVRMLLDRPTGALPA